MATVKSATGTLIVHNKGFTLIEILIVMVIISIVSTVAVLTISFNQKKQIQTLANQFVNSITLAQEEAMLRPATIGLALTNDTFQFFEFSFDKKKWLPIHQKSLSLHRIPDTMQISLQMQGENIPLNGEPKIIFSESGDISSFIIFIGKKGSSPSYQVIGNANGEVKSEIVQ